MPRNPQTIPDHLTALHNALTPLSGKMMRLSLRYLGLDAPNDASVAASAKKVIRHVVAGDLSEEAAWSLVLDAREYSNKRVYLYRADPRHLAGWTPSDPRAIIADLGGARIRMSAGPLPQVSSEWSSSGG